jgi:glutathione S-transferase
MTSYKLTYFPLRNLAQVSRVLFALGGQEFEDVHISFEDWPNHKSAQIFHQIPVLEFVDENGKTVRLAQSNTVERFLANKFDLFGENDLERARIDMICEQVMDLHLVFINIYSSLYYKRAGHELKRIQLEKVLTETAPASLKLIEKLYEQNQAVTNNSGFLVGNKLTYGDIKLVNIYDWLLDRKDAILEQAPRLREHYDKIRSLPKLKEHYSKSDNLQLTLYI